MSVAKLAQPGRDHGQAVTHGDRGGLVQRERLGGPYQLGGTRGPGTGRVCLRSAPRRGRAAAPTPTITAVATRAALAKRPGALAGHSPHGLHVFSNWALLWRAQVG